METSSIIKHLLCDEDSLTGYFKGETVSFEDVKRRMLLLERRQDCFVPDHYYRLNQEKSFEGINSLSELLCDGLWRIADEHFLLKQNRVYIRQEKQNDWQELVTFIPPLVLQAVLLHKRKPITATDADSVRRYFNKFILPNARYTALPSPYIPQLEAYLDQEKGLNDLHVHLNGSTETDMVWQDFLLRPEKAYYDMKGKYASGSSDGNLFKEQLEQEGWGTPSGIRDLLYIARRLRNYFFEIIFPTQQEKEQEEKEKDKQEEDRKEKDKEKDKKEGEDKKQEKTREQGEKEILQRLVNRNDSSMTDYDYIKNPFSDFFDDEVKQNHPMAVEGLMYVLVFGYLSDNNDNVVSRMFHFYLLILGHINRLLVQQTNQVGFEQFKKITVNELRSQSEKKYRNRFLQLCGNDLRYVSFLGGRFAPKSSKTENLRLLANINKGWKSLQERCEEVSFCNELCGDEEGEKMYFHKKLWEEEKEYKKAYFHDQIHGESKKTGSRDGMPELKLIAHFIKQKDTDTDNYIRHKKLRKEIWQKASVLALMKKNDAKYIDKLVGIDAASSEFDAPPEVFAPAFRMLRKREFRYFTYHAGEDFFHILSGLRAIYEAVDFLELGHGDRIGHAVACGLGVKIWQRNVGDKILIRKGEYLDDLVFVYALINKQNIEQLKPQLPQIALKISEYSFCIYGKYYSVEMLIEAWKLRKYCPMMLLSGSKEVAKSYSVYSSDEWYEIRKTFPSNKGKLIKSNANAEDSDTEVYLKGKKLDAWGKISNRREDKRIEILEMYHNRYHRKKYDEIIEINIFDLLDAEAITTLQQAVLKYLHRKEIVIETLPTSNVRIGHHHHFETYHLWNWVRWEEEGKSIPPIVLGTDDAGIFATNIYNEYSNIYCYLTDQCKMTHDKAMQLIEKLDKNAAIYRFTETE